MNGLYDSFQKALENINKPYNKIIFICIGTDRCIGDSYGPIVGSILKEKFKNDKVEIYGTIHEPVHAKNITTVLQSIDSNNNLIIAIDAALGGSDDIGNIFIKNKPMEPGMALGKNLGSIGDISIKGITAVDSNFAFVTLQNTRLSMVYDLAKSTVDDINKCLNNITVEEIACTK